METGQDAKARHELLVYQTSAATTITMIPTAPPRTTVRADPAVTYVALADGGPYGVLPVGSGSVADANGVGVTAGLPLLTCPVDVVCSVDVMAAG